MQPSPEDPPEPKPGAKAEKPEVPEAGREEEELLEEAGRLYVSMRRKAPCNVLVFLLLFTVPHWLSGGRRSSRFSSETLLLLISFEATLGSGGWRVWASVSTGGLH